MTKKIHLPFLYMTLWTFVVFGSCFFATGRVAAEALSPRIANYTIAVTLDVEKKTLHGSETLVWTNSTRDVVRDLQFHFYLNAFKNTYSTFIRESGGRLRGDVMTGDGWGWGEQRGAAGGDRRPGPQHLRRDPCAQHRRVGVPEAPGL